ncbi:MAG: acetyl-CoA carboxylase biotin carboxylase subunit [Bryobacterales bacterium]|jgi:acetyl-CoA carboxylase biotin carboxylase subunit|nr:acetyl-CoA carboxylase biotin carboxylase subunit [Bryobacterales bacterium]
MFTKVLVANRGEIAVRVMRALKEFGIASVAVYSDVDRGALHVRMADEAVAIGPADSRESYLNIPRVVDAALRTGAQAVHPGYGFLSENAAFAQACVDAGLVFIGPSPDSIRSMGSKTAARAIARDAGVPTVPGAAGAVTSLEEALAVAAAVGYPVLLKAAAGGGGKGMRLVESPAEMEAALRDAAGEAERAFHDGRVYIEKAVLRPRHIEIQVLGDQYGNLIHLGERECSLQRRHQKVIEECPSPLMREYPELRQQMGEAALRAARAAGYYNAGTVEFLVDEQRNFYFLEMNTRLQVEHPVTEWVTGLDLVHEQLRIASGERLTLRQEDVRWHGASLECRIYAEDPENHFFPSPGRITRLERPAGPGVRVDSGVYLGWTIPMEYDPLIAKLSVHAATRELAIARMRSALEEYSVDGVKTTIGFFHHILQDEEFVAGRLHTGFLADYFARRELPPTPREIEDVAALVGAMEASRGGPASGASAPTQVRSLWKERGRLRSFR